MVCQTIKIMGVGVCTRTGMLTTLPSAATAENPKFSALCNSRHLSLHTTGM